MLQHDVAEGAGAGAGGVGLPGQQQHAQYAQHQHQHQLLRLNLSLALRLTGVWLAETRAENSDKILEELLVSYLPCSGH